MYDSINDINISIRGSSMAEANHKTLMERVYDVLDPDDTSGPLSHLANIGLMILIVLSVIVAFISTFTEGEYASLILLEGIFVIIFSIEYVLRMWTAVLIYPDLTPFKARVRYALTPLALIDLLSILPFFLPLIGVSSGALQTMRLIRLLRVFKINRYTDSLYLIGRVLKNRATQLISSIVVIFILIFIAAMLMYDVEHAAQPGVFKNALSAMWWAMSTITTVGYGDIYPITNLGRMLSAVVTFLGIGLTAIPTGIISAGFIEELQNEDHENVKEAKYCKHCGEKID